MTALKAVNHPNCLTQMNSLLLFTYPEQTILVKCVGHLTRLVLIKNTEKKEEVELKRKTGAETDRYPKINT